MKHEVAIFMFFKIVLYYTVSSTSTNLTRLEDLESTEFRSTKKANSNHAQVVSSWFRNENSTFLSSQYRKPTIRIRQSCITDSDCKGHSNNDLICSYRKMNKMKGLCRCPKGSKFDRESLSCIKRRSKRNEFHYPGCKSDIGKKCTDQYDCKATNSYCDIAGDRICKCEVGYKEVNKSYCEKNNCANDFFTCDPKLFHACCNSLMECINITPELQTYTYKCVRRNNLDNNCDQNLDCISINNAKCGENHTCVCKLGAFRYNEICLNETYEKPLTSKYSNFFYPNEKKYHINPDKVIALRLKRESETMYGEPCNETNDCKTKGNHGLHCIAGDNQYNSKGYCKCNDGTSYDSKKNDCTEQRYEQLKEEKKIILYAETHIPKDGQYYSIYGGDCLKNSDCSELKNGFCKNGQCACKPASKAVNKTFCKFESKMIPDRCSLTSLPCTSHEECLVENSFCNKTFCDCGEEDYYLNGKCSSRRDGVGSPCKCEQACIGLKYGKCKDNKCVCEENYHIRGKRCAGELGQPCDGPEDCFASNSTCKNKRCECEDDHYSLGNDCVRKSRHINDLCFHDKACQDLKNTKCKDGHCQCLPNYKLGEKGCSVVHKGSCKNSEDCLAKNAICKNKICDCPENFYFKDDNCFEKALLANDPCHSNEACKNINNTSCVGEKCRCDENFVIKNGTCQALVIPTPGNSTKLLTDVSCLCPDGCYFQKGQCLCRDDSSCGSKSYWSCKFNKLSSNLFSFTEKMINFKQKALSKIIKFYNYFNKN